MVLSPPAFLILGKLDRISVCFRRFYCRIKLRKICFEMRRKIWVEILQKGKRLYQGFYGLFHKCIAFVIPSYCGEEIVHLLYESIFTGIYEPIYIQVPRCSSIRGSYYIVERSTILGHCACRRVICANNACIRTNYPSKLV